MRQAVRETEGQAPIVFAHVKRRMGEPMATDRNYGPDLQITTEFYMHATANTPAQVTKNGKGHKTQLGAANGNRRGVKEALTLAFDDAWSHLGLW